ncbi:MAG: glycosyltransferase family 39 protein, partial [Candidatus Thermoplasmatota archaeon]|nr:glycosyltransferase family 39 protein [Candidatus Thermoplasmatota archaeon]
MGKVRDGIKRTMAHWPAAVAVLLGIALRAALSRFMFLQADEEIFSYDAYYFVLGRSLDFIVGKIGAYLLYPLALSGWFKLFGVSLFGARLFTVLCWGVIMSAFYLIIIKVTGNRKWAFIGTLLLAVLPYPLRYGHVALSEPIAWAFITVSLFLLIDGMERDRWWTMLLAGSLVAVAFFARRSALILPIFIVPGLVWVNRGSPFKAAKQALVYGAGFVLPMVIGIGTFTALFGLDRLLELGFLNIPNMTQEWAIDLSTVSTFDSALYAIQPTIWKSLPLLVPFLAGCLVLLSSLHRNIWRVIYTSCLLWPALIRMALDGEASSMEIFIVTLVPLLSILPFLARLEPQKAGISLALLLGSAVAFSTTTLSLDIWNVILYTGVGAVLLVYLDDRLDSQLGSFVLLGAGLFLLTLICFREPQINTLLSYLVPVAGAAFFLMLPRDNAPNVPQLLKVTGLVLLQLMVRIPDLTGLYLPFILILPLLGLLALGDWGERFWKVIRYLTALGALAFIPMVPRGMSEPMIVTVLLVVLLLYVSHLFPRTGWTRLAGSVTGAVVSFVIIWSGTGSLVLGGVAAVLCGSASAISTSIVDLSMTWRHRVPERVSVVLLLIVIAYLAFYIYYAWTEVYLMELIVPASIITALFLFV